MQGKGA
jgi:hypothetical protein